MSPPSFSSTEPFFSLLFLGKRVVVKSTKNGEKVLVFPVKRQHKETGARK